MTVDGRRYRLCVSAALLTPSSVPGPARGPPGLVPPPFSLRQSVAAPPSLLTWRLWKGTGQLF